MTTWRVERGDYPRRSSEWYACEEPERPTDGHVRWHYDLPAGAGPCNGCRIKAEMLLREYPDDTSVQWVHMMLTGGVS